MIFVWPCVQDVKLESKERWVGHADVPVLQGLLVPGFGGT